MKFYKDALILAKSVQETADAYFLPPVEIHPLDKHNVIPQILFKGTRGYLEKIAYQVNTSYENGCYDACAVMTRRLVEILIIEAYECQKMESKIKNNNSEFLALDDLINKALAEHWNLSRNTKRGLRSVKKVGDLSAHSRRYNTNRADLDEVIGDLRVLVEEFLYLCGFRK